MTPSLVVGIDASRNRSGGARAHIIGILSEGNPLDHGIREVHIWTYKSLLDSLPGRHWLHKHNPSELERSLSWQLWWQAAILSREASAAGCNVMFSTDATTLCFYKPQVVLSQDLLPYEPGEIKRLGISYERARNIVRRIFQSRAMIKADGVIFLTHHAASTIQQALGYFSKTAVIPHGVDSKFSNPGHTAAWPDCDTDPIRVVYVSNAAPYKHNWTVVKAVELLRRRGYNTTLTLVGGGSGRGQRLLENQIFSSDPDRLFVEQKPFVAHDEVLTILARSHVFVFASSCENMPVSLLEAMSVGLPVASSNRGPMPEVLWEGGCYFDPEDPTSIANSIEKIILDKNFRTEIVCRALERSRHFNWRRCASDTFQFLSSVATNQTAY